MTSPLYVEDNETWETPDGVTVVRRDAFASRYFHYEAGEHVVFGGPSTRGKTTLAFDLLESVAKPTFPAYVAVSKPNDKVTAERGEALGFRRVSEWPPPPKLQELKIWNGKPPGYLVWSHFGDLDKDMERSAVLTERLLNDRYTAGSNPKSQGGVLVMDDTMVKAKIMGLDKHMVTILAMAGAMKIGLWIFVQKPTDSGRTTLWGYEMATHLFFTKGGDHRMMLRYVEILGDKGKAAMSIIPTLKPFQFLYVHRHEGYMCIVEAGP